MHIYVCTHIYTCNKNIISTRILFPFFFLLSSPSLLPFSLPIICLESENAAEAFPLMEQLEGLVNLIEFERVCDVLIQHGLAIHVLLDQLRDIYAAFVPPEGGAHPLASCHQLEGARGDFLARRRHPNDHGFAPPSVSAFKGGPHDLDVSDAFEGVVTTPLRLFIDHSLDGLIEVFRIETIRRAELLSGRELIRIQVDGVDGRGTCLLRGFDDGQTHRTQAEDCDGGVGLHLGGVEDGTPTSADATAEETDLV
mmetsp:Transcript_22711/g.40207  ORF Transcript_22711/g.40207 Transcript_22711/m.40207 type:complete len:253 (+) Transcript_22711:346-1104(+)